MSDDLFHLFGIGHLFSSFITDDTMLRKSGVRKEDISRVFDNVKDRFVLGYKLLLSAFFDSKTTIPCDF